ncbi:MAG: 3-hydroxybutyrate dehydrogenase [Rhodovibrionaceae bacterium]|nr:3-hydroxybutyrate dehydrogenase [Rhodovibrionaceae bacterium]
MLKGKTALVTGSTSGIGKAIAEAFAAEGANIVLNGFGDADEIEQLRRALEEKSGAKAIYDDADMSKPDQIEAMIARAEETFGAVDVLVNNAGIQHVDSVEDFPAEKWEAVLSINLSSNFYAIKRALPKMRERGWGRIINIASAHGLVASPYKTAYVAAKHGVVGLTKVIAIETGGSGITCNAICPGWVLTPLVEKQIDAQAQEKNVSFEQAKKDFLAKMPSKDFVKPEQIGGFAVFLCQPAADQITGAPLTIDGAWTSQ